MNTKSTKIEPHKVTKPIQLLAAWLAGLVLIDTGFLFTAVKLGSEVWSSNALVLAAIFNVPLFLAAIFVLQTKFRPELQEDSYYSEYLDKKSNKLITTKDSSKKDSQVVAKIGQLQSSVSRLLENKSTQDLLTPFIWRGWKVDVNDLHKNIAEIKRSLNDAGIPIEDYFGSSSLGTGPPEKFVIGFRQSMDLNSCLHVLRHIAPLGFQGYYYFDEDFEPADVYIGSYAYPSNLIPIDSTLLELINSENLNSASFRQYESQCT